MSRMMWSAALLAGCAGLLVVGCGGDKTDNGGKPPVGTGVFTPGIFSDKVTISLTGSNSLCRAIPATVDTQIDTLCDAGQIAELLGLPVDSLVVNGNEVHVSGPFVLDVEGCTITLHGTGDGQFYSEWGDLTINAGITSLSAGSACDPLRELPCQFQVHIESTRTGPPPAGFCTTAPLPGPADILGISWEELKPRAR